eukprot:c31947_g1_i1 orf=3-167(-)
MQSLLSLHLVWNGSGLCLAGQMLDAKFDFFAFSFRMERCKVYSLSLHLPWNGGCP